MDFKMAAGSAPSAVQTSTNSKTSKALSPLSTRAMNVGALPSRKESWRRERPTATRNSAITSRSLSWSVRC